MKTSQEADGQAVKPYVENIDSLREAVENARGLFRLLFEARAFYCNDDKPGESGADAEETTGIKTLIFDVSWKLKREFEVLDKQDNKLRLIAQSASGDVNRKN